MIEDAWNTGDLETYCVPLRSTAHAEIARSSCQAVKQPSGFYDVN